MPLMRVDFSSVSYVALWPRPEGFFVVVKFEKRLAQVEESSFAASPKVTTKEQRVQEQRSLFSCMTAWASPRISVSWISDFERNVTKTSLKSAVRRLALKTCVKLKRFLVFD